MGLEWVRGCKWELHSLEPSEAPGTWQHGSSPAPSVLHRTGSCGKHSIFRIWGSLEQGWGGRGQRLLSLQQRGQNSRKEEGPDEPLSWPLLGCRAGSSWALLCSHGHGRRHQAPTARALRWQLDPCFSLPRVVASVSGVRVGSQGCASQHSSQPSRAAVLSVLVVAFIKISSL